MGIGSLKWLAADLRGREWKPTDQTQTVNKVEADSEVAEAPGVMVGSPVYERARIVKDAEKPTHTLTSYY
ncbi:hypothetical protein [Amycolatopsis sp. NPDC004378]